MKELIAAAGGETCQQDERWQKSHEDDKDGDRDPFDVGAGHIVHPPII